MQRITVFKGLSPFLSIQRRTFHDNVQKRFLATVKEVFPQKTDFPSRHIGPRKTEVVAMLDYIGYKVRSFIFLFDLKKKSQTSDIVITKKINSEKCTNFTISKMSKMSTKKMLIFQSLDELTDSAVPKHIQLRRDLKLDEPFSK